MIDYRIIAAENLLVVCQSGEPNLEEVQAMRQRMRADPKFTLKHDSILEVSGLTKQFDLSHMKSLVENRSPDSSTPRKLAIITGEKDITYAVHRQYAAMADARDSTREAQVFRSTEDALNWLGRPDFDLASVIQDMRSFAD